MAPMEAAETQPDAVLVPAQDFDARAGLVAEDKNGLSLPGLVQMVGNVLRQGINAATHTNRLACQPDVLRR